MPGALPTVDKLARCQACSKSASAPGTRIQPKANRKPPASHAIIDKSAAPPGSATGRTADSALHGSEACSGVPSTRVVRQLKVGEQASVRAEAASTAHSGEIGVGVMPHILAHTVRMSAAHLPAIASLRQSAERANAAGQPLVIMTTLAGCPWCDTVRNQYLGPMQAKGDVVAFELDVRERSLRLQAFDGSFTTPAEQARAWKARFAPTVLFWNAQGQELAERLVGVAVPELYGAYLEQRLAEARRRLR